MYRGVSGNILEHGDEIWMHHVTPETKINSMPWKNPLTTSSQIQQSVKKVLETVFSGEKGVLLIDFILYG